MGGGCWCVYSCSSSCSIIIVLVVDLAVVLVVVLVVVLAIVLSVVVSVPGLSLRLRQNIFAMFFQSWPNSSAIGLRGGGYCSAAFDVTSL